MYKIVINVRKLEKSKGSYKTVFSISLYNCIIVIHILILKKHISTLIIKLFYSYKYQPGDCFVVMNAY